MEGNFNKVSSKSERRKFKIDYCVTSTDLWATSDMTEPSPFCTKQENGCSPNQWTVIEVGVPSGSSPVPVNNIATTTQLMGIGVDDVKQEYENVVEAIASNPMNQSSLAWQKNRKQIEDTHSAACKVELPAYDINKWFPPTPPLCAIVKNDDVEPKLKSTTTMKLWTADANFTVIAPLQTMGPVERLPYMNSWNYTSTNVLTSDQLVLGNIPYLGEQFLKNEEKSKEFMKELVIGTYGKKFHGTNTACIQEDDVFLALVRGLVNRENEDMFILKEDLTRDGMLASSSSEKKSGTNGNAPDPEPSFKIFQAIARTFKEGSARELRERYEKLQGRVPPIPPENLVPNIDGPTAKSISRKRVLNSFITILCQRCYTYDCFLHSDMEMRGSIRRKDVDDEVPVLPSTKPCSPTCYLRYMNHSSGSNINLEEERKISPPSPSTSSQGLRQLSEANKSMFRAIQKIYKTDYCRMAVVLRDTTCQAVFNFAREELPQPNQQDPDPPSAQALTAPKKKRPNSKRRIPIVMENVLNTYVPCDHEGACEDSNEDCYCLKSTVRVHCEKYCNCGPDCPNRFPGCKCTAKCKTNACPCKIASRECDPDLCHSCGAGEEDASKMRCENANCLRGIKKHLLLGVSDVAGWGCFIKDGANKDDFIAEYRGELISNDECERRGLIYDKKKCSYLFALNNDYGVDGTKLGNKIRFANHSPNSNCYSVVLKVKGDHRIGIFAKRQIKPGEELFLAYKNEKDDQLGHSIPVYCNSPQRKAATKNYKGKKGNATKRAGRGDRPSETASEPSEPKLTRIGRVVNRPRLPQ